jgi:hypothetical protein
MKTVVAVEGGAGERVEVTITLPDGAEDALARNVNGIRESLRLIAQRAASQAAENVFVAKKDLSDEQMRLQLAADQPASTAPRGPNQIAFAGSKAPAVEVPGTGGGR